MKAIFQCLVHIKKLYDYLVTNKEIIKSKAKENKLSNSFLVLIENLRENNLIEDHSLYTIINSLNELNPSLINNKIKNDFTGLVLFLIETLHKELNTNKNNNQIFSRCFDENIDIYFDKHEKHFKTNFKSIISELFYFKYNIKTLCFIRKKTTSIIQLSNLL